MSSTALSSTEDPGPKLDLILKVEDEEGLSRADSLRQERQEEPQPECGNSFRYRNQLIAHEKVHMAEKEGTEGLRVTVLENHGETVQGEPAQKRSPSPAEDLEASVEMVTISENHREVVIGESKPETNLPPNTGEILEAEGIPEDPRGQVSEEPKPEIKSIIAVTVGGTMWEGAPVFVKNEENTSD
ncbi:UNVERIFIED_CONTAM: hypothetical protein K2H54_003235 [Gekko kuhli]